MKTIFYVMMALAFCLPVAAQPLTENPDVLPQYPDGNAGLFRFLNDNMAWSAEDRERMIEGEMIVTFTVHTDGKLSGIEVKKGLSPAINNGMVGVIQKMPPWRSARDEGQWVSARYSLAMVIQAHKQEVRPLF